MNLEGGKGLGRKSTSRCSTYDETSRSMTPLANPERPTFHLFPSAVAFSDDAMFSTEDSRVLRHSAVNRIDMIHGAGGILWERTDNTIYPKEHNTFIGSR